MSVCVGVARAMSYISMKAPTSLKMSEASCAVGCVCASVCVYMCVCVGGCGLVGGWV